VLNTAAADADPPVPQSLRLYLVRRLARSMASLPPTEGILRGPAADWWCGRSRRRRLKATRRGKWPAMMPECMLLPTNEIGSINRVEHQPGNLPTRPWAGGNQLALPSSQSGHCPDSGMVSLWIPRVMRGLLGNCPFSVSKKAHYWRFPYGPERFHVFDAPRVRC
jgi:hypothetical protein